MNSDGSGQLRLTNEPSSDAEPVISPDGTKIAFRSSRDGNEEIYLMNSDGSNPVNLTSNPGNDFSPAFSPDGSKILFTSNRDSADPGDREIYVMNVNGSNAVRVADSATSDSEPKYSPDGSLIIFSRRVDFVVGAATTFGADVFVMHANGTEPARLTNAIARVFYQTPSFSPDGTKIVLHERISPFSGPSENRIVVMNSDGTAQIQLTSAVNLDSKPSFSPDGSQIAFVSARDGELAIYKMNADGTGQQRLTTVVGVDQSPSWGVAPNPAVGTKIAFNSRRDGNDEIYLMNADGTGQTRLTNDAAVDTRPSIDPSLTKIVFESNRDGDNEIFVMNADGSGLTNLTNNSSSDIMPSFSSDGSKIVFSCSPDGSFEICTMNVNGSDLTRLTTNSVPDLDPHFNSVVNKIVFSSDSDIYSMNADGTDRTNLTNSTALDFDPVISPDGSKVAFDTQVAVTRDIFLMNIDGSDPTNLTNNPEAADGQASFSPDGTQIAFGSFRSDNGDVYVMNIDGSGQHRITDALGIDQFPSWGGQASASGTAPTVTAATVVRVENTSAVGVIATATDADQAEESLTVNVTPLTGSGVSVAGVVINATGEISANVSAGCGATNSTFEVMVTDEDGNTSSAVVTVTVMSETVDPVIDPIANIVVDLPLNSAATSMPVDFPLPTATDNCSTPTVTTDPVSGSNFNVGTTTVTATDDRGNDTTSSFTVTVRYSFAGFFQPVDNLPALNIASAGTSIPLKFSLSGDKGLNIIAAGFPASGQIPCDASEPGSTVEETVASGGSSLSYSATTDQYTYIWKTQKSWKNSCRILVLRLNDGTEHLAKFRFR